MFVPFQFCLWFLVFATFDHKMLLPLQKATLLCLLLLFVFFLYFFASCGSTPSSGSHSQLNRFNEVSCVLQFMINTPNQ